MLKFNLMGAWTVAVAMFACVGCVGAADDSSDEAAQGSETDQVTTIDLGNQPVPTLAENPNGPIVAASKGASAGRGEESNSANPRGPAIPSSGALTPAIGDHMSAPQVPPVALPACGDGYCPPDAPNCVTDEDGEPACEP